MRVRVTLTVEVDPVAWQAIYDSENIRDDVRKYAALLVAGSAAAEEGAILDAHNAAQGATA